jgi:hypothetical protein
MKKEFTEGFKSEGAPDLKYYAFDWDDNIVHMPTKILVQDEDGNEVGMSTDDFAEFRHKIGQEPFTYKGNTIIDYSDSPFRNFRTEGDKRFVIDAMLAKPGPSWNDFVECINGGSIFSIITARGHNPNTLKEATYNFIISNHNGINKKTLVDNLKKYRSLTSSKLKESFDVDFTDKELINEYLDLCRFYPVTFGEGSAANPEEGKIKAMREFISYCRELAQLVGKKAYFKNDVENNEVIPTIGFSDDDLKNVEKMKEFLSKEYDKNPVKTYLTKGGEKKEF